MTAHLLRAAGLTRSFGDDRAVGGIDLTVAPGEIHALVGLNGAGKTTLLRLLLGMLRPDAGSVTVALAPLPPVDVRRAGGDVWRHVGHLVETPFTYPELTVAETVHAAARLHGLSRAEAAAATARVVEDLDLGRWSARRTGALSLGNRQRVGLACAVVHRPRLLLLDEPTNALDPAGVVRVRRLLLAAAGQGAGVLVSSHHLDEVARIAHRITVVHRGRVIGTLPPHEADLERAFFTMALAADGVRA